MMKQPFNKQPHHNKWLLGGLLSLFLLLAAPQATKAQMATSNANEFRRIEQPLALKLGVAAAGIGLIGLELWWFLLSKNKAQTAQVAEGIQSVDIIVDGGYTPDQVEVKVGQPVRLHFLRKDPSGCLEQIILPDFSKAVDLPLNQKTVVEILPEKAGSYSFHCGMNMFRGTLTAKEES